jgi:hypothetical protein
MNSTTIEKKAKLVIAKNLYATIAVSGGVSHGSQTFISLVTETITFIGTPLGTRFIPS